ncbi:Rha family transcriptional regulator [Methylomonas sp. 11b]|uniref:Rha family transcriptional regulator n=1 Tax=Methylomonas sp. 11b TaxID=1168169 RepID=UPI0004790FE5|nr:Rha family transcriptional regulator [Methylomonas sp. 11b]
MKALAKSAADNQAAHSSIQLIIHGGSNQVSVDSREIANEFGRRHDNVLQTLDSLLLDGTLSLLECKERTYQKLGRQYRCFELNEAGFLKAMPFIGGRKSREGQKRLVDEFLRVRRQLDRQAKERETLAYQVARLSGKDSRGILTDAIQQFADYARGQGSQNADRYFSIITNAVYKALVIIEPQATEIRALLTAVQLKTLELAELTAAQALTEGMESQQPYKDIYQAAKAALDGVVGARVKILGG